MKIGIHGLRFSMFNGRQSVLDLDTGDISNIQLIIEGLEKMPKHYQFLPNFSRAPLYQKYFNMAFKVLPIEDRFGLKDFPEFELSNAKFTDMLYEYLDRAVHFNEDVHGLIIQERKKDNPGFDPSFPTFGEYFLDFTLSYAKDWCAKEGYEWYEE